MCERGTQVAVLLTITYKFDIFIAKKKNQIGDISLIRVDLVADLIYISTLLVLYLGREG